jgi:type II secretory pathway component GspD/PulD (secretin)
MFPLKHRMANEIIPVIKPMLGQDAAVTGEGFNLIVRAPEQSLQQVRDIISQLDRAPQRLRISVRQHQSDTVSRQDIGVSGTIRSGDARIQLSKPGPARLKLHESTGRSAKNGTQTVHTLEGQQAFIQVGQLVPVPERSIDRYGVERESIQYKNATTGFYVLPRLSGDQVILDISPHSISLNRHGQQKFDVQQAQTTLRGKVGEWLSIGGVQQKAHSSSKGITYSTRRQDGLDSNFQIRVEIIAE